MSNRKTTTMMPILVPMLLGVFLPVAGLAQENQTRGVRPVQAPITAENFYGESHALLIGASAYTAGWPALASIPAEIDQLAAVLREQGFVVRRLMDPTREQLFDGINEFISNHGFHEDKRVLIWFSGHGYSQDGRGFLVPVDAPDPHRDETGFRQKSLTMNQVKTWAQTMDANHVLFLFDSCFSGTVFTSRGLPDLPLAGWDRLGRPVRQFITAGSADEEVPARSQFQQSFVQALEGPSGENADNNGDGLVTGTELGFFLQQQVQIYNSQQTPQFGKIRDSELDKGEFLFFIETTGEDPPERCHDIRTNPAGFFPLALLNSAKSHDIPFWFQATLENECDHPLHLEYTFEVLDGPAFCENHPLPMTVDSGAIDSDYPKPVLRFTGAGPDTSDSFPIEIAWRVRDHLQNILDSGTSSISLLPKSTFCFDLKDIHGVPMADEFLLATLAAWYLSPAKKIKELGITLFDEVDWHTTAPPEADTWLAHCYDRLFNATDPVQVFSHANRFPPLDRRTINPAAKVLSERLADPLEAGLFIAAVGRTRSRRAGFVPVLTVADGQENPGNQRFFLAWETTENGWRAIDLAQISRQEFAANFATATPEFAAILARAPGMRDDLARTGVHIGADQGLWAIEFEQAKKHHRIAGLP